MTTEANQQTIGTVFDVQKAKSDLVSNLKKLKGFYLYLKLDDFSLIDKVVERVENQSFSVAVFGMFRTGKSTFINALLGQDILPSDVTPTTATINRVTYGVTPSALPDLWLKLYWMIHFAFLAFAEGLAVPRY
jgi:ribosome biogenesis GTPase A